MTIHVTWSQTNENLKPKSFGYVYEKHLETYLKKKPSTLIRSALQTSTENNLLQLVVTNASKAIYWERRNNFPALPKSKDDFHDAVEILDTKTNKSEIFVISNDRYSGIIIFSTRTNLQSMCREMDEWFIDGTFKCCLRYFCQLYTIHGLKNGNYVPLVFCLLPSKTEMCYTAMWSLIIDLQEQEFEPTSDFISRRLCIML